jgi:hypothetical protein
MRCSAMNISQAIETSIRTIPASAIIWGFGYLFQKVAGEGDIQAPRWLIYLCCLNEPRRGIHSYAAAVQIMALAIPFMKLADWLVAPVLKLPVPDTVFRVGTVAVFLIALLLLRILPHSNN